MNLKRILEGAAAAAVILVAIGILIFLFETSSQLDALNARVSTLLVTTNEAMQNLRDAAGSARDASAQVNLAAQEQRGYWNKTTLETYKTMASLRLAISRIDSGITKEILPRVSKNLEDTDRISIAAADQLTQTMDALRPGLVNFARGSAAAADVMADPRIRDAIGHVDASSAHFEDLSRAAAGTAVNVEDTSGDVKDYVHRMTSPARGTLNFFEWLLGLAAKTRQAGGI